jgi:hypothetical protein
LGQQRYSISFLFDKAIKVHYVWSIYTHSRSK